MKNFFTYPVFLVLFLSFIGMMGFGAIVKYNYEGGKKYQFLQNLVMVIVEVPEHIRFTMKNGIKDPNKLIPLTKHKDKKKFEQYIKKQRNALLLLPRYEFSLSRSVVDVVDLKNFEVIHTYKHEIDKVNDKVKNTEEFPNLRINHSPKRFQYQHPLLFSDGSLTSIYGPMFKLDFCSNLLWINDEENFHHSQMIDHDGNIWVGGQMNPKSRMFQNFPKYQDDSIIKINTDGKILLNKSLSEILIENNLVDDNIFYTGYDALHLNDIEPVLNNGKYWKQGDLFLSIRNKSAIIHYRPSNNKVINYITGPFVRQHDVDIISNKEISIFNNNSSETSWRLSEVLVYNFETDKFKKLINEQLQKENFKTISNGLSEIFIDGSLMVEEHNHGRIILFNNQGEKEWEFVNKDINNDIGRLQWSRIIEDKKFIEKFKSLVKNKKCLN